ncbi:MAG: NYN domain-containing protein, partial [bacterium]
SIEKQVDVYIASQMVALAYENAYDVAILVSGDQDFVPAVETVQQKGKVVMVVSSEAGISNLLKRKADRAVLIDAPGDLNFKGFLKNATSEA